jgi:hypothetical protein
MTEFKVANSAKLFHQGADSLIQFFAEQGRSDNDMLLAFDEVDKFLSIADKLAQQAANHDIIKIEQFNQQVNKLILLIDKLIVFSSQIKHQESFSCFEQFLFLFVLWFCHVNGIISNLIPIVNLIAALTNRLRNLEQLSQLLINIDCIIKAVDQTIQDDMDNRDPRRPWRVLLFNYAITATRTHNPKKMEKTFQFLVQHLPDDAAQFFTEGMGQMDALNYPKDVKEVMKKYYWQYAKQIIKKN